MSASKATTLDNAARTAHLWLREVAHGFPTEDEQFAYRALRAWLHAVRDQLTPQAAVHFGAQLPDLLRGVFYEGWNIDHVPHRLDAAGFVASFAQHAGVSAQDVPRTAAVVSAGLAARMSPGQVDKALGHLPHDVRDLLRPRETAR
ncbi:DUF2267 domain-containing protein [Actinokineospora iranica]|uniref:Uncharacterized conserved protein, DUF2267 family n=1 Tax=Actinokineospora iranica TaxID=1271860 RepID=A0A1G6JT57_9PSEU|nr:DUF2267 domain-containing protein [Actinokineospora iranica]SDC21186.1 Uncharacterized conserved protein, DUF2267 family [Actinokineospora iranica]